MESMQWIIYHFSSALPEKNKYDEYHSLYIQILKAGLSVKYCYSELLKSQAFKLQSRSKSREQTFLQTKAEKFKVHSHSRNNNIPFISPQRDACSFWVCGGGGNSWRMSYPAFVVPGSDCIESHSRHESQQTNTK